MNNIYTKKRILKMIQEKKIDTKEGLSLYRKAQMCPDLGHVMLESVLEMKPLSPQSKLSFNKILLFCRDKEQLEQVKLQLSARNIQVIGILPGVCYEEKAIDVYQICHCEVADYVQLIKKFMVQDCVIDRVIYMWHIGLKDIDLQIQKSFNSIICLTQAYITLKNTHPIKLLFMNDLEENGFVPCYEALEALFKSIRIEDERYNYKIISAQHINTIADYLEELEEDNSHDCNVYYEHTSRLVKEYNEVTFNDELKEQSVNKKNGVYIITGGASGVGFNIAIYLANKYQARLVLVGRRAKDVSIEERINHLEELGGMATYCECNISDFKQVATLIKEVKNKFNTINGVIHCAGIAKDAFLINKSLDDMKQVLAPKIYGVLNLDMCLKDEALDYFVMFSSISAVLGNAGQCDYAFANSFMDYYAKEREAKRSQNERRGQTLSINWSLWSEGTMSVPAEREEWVAENFGLIPLPNEEGTDLFELALQSKKAQYIPIYGLMSKIKNYVFVGNKNDQKTEEYCDEMSQEILSDKTTTFIKNVFSEVLELSLKQIDLQITLQEYGIDSIMVNRFNMIIGKNIIGLPQTLLFDCVTIENVVEYLIQHNKEDLMKMFVCHSKKVVQEKKDSARSISKDIAIIGMSGQFPKADNYEEFWRNLKQGRDCISEVPKARWKYEDYFTEYTEEYSHGKTYCKWGGFIDNVDKFDSAFFNLSPREANVMDPQERLFLENVWHAFEDAGYSIKVIKEESQSNIGVFVGVTTNTYMLWGDTQLREGKEYIPQSYPWSIANRVSYIFDFKGPSIPVDTACSSSLTAIHMACESLKNEECEVAVAGGVNLYLHPLKYIMLSQMKMLSKTGKCHTFGDDADGFVPGEGVGALILKPLDKAIEDQDHIYGVIKSSAINHSGMTTGYTVPSPNAQADLIMKAIEIAKINPRTISYIEAHGTGTRLGDPIEVEGLTKAFGHYTRDTKFCAIGSVKSDMGHAEAAAGISSVMKVLMQLKYKQLAPSLHSKPLNKNINFEKTPFYVVDELKSWEKLTLKDKNKEVTYPRRAGISAFGAGGANAHIIIEEFESNKENKVESNNRVQVIILSAKTREALRANAKKMHDYIKVNQNEMSLEEFAYTLQVGRSALDERLAFIIHDWCDVLEKLEGFLQKEQDCERIYLGNVRDEKKNALSAKKLEEIIAKEDYELLADAWVKGSNIEWKHLYSDRLPLRIVLPNYTFQKKHYWIDRDLSVANSTTSVGKVGQAIADISAKQKSQGLFKLNLEKELEIFKTKVNGDEVRLETIDGQIAVIYMEDKANSNMMTSQLYYMLLKTFNQIDSNPNIKVIILTGYDHVFCMGGTKENLSDIANMKEKCSTGSIIFKGLLSCQIPVISAMQGHAMGGGFVFGLFADIIVMAEECLYSTNFMKYGFTPGVGSTYILKDKLTSNLALEMMFSAKEYTGMELKQRGASFIFKEQEKVIDEAINMAKLLAKKPLKSLKVLKKELSERVLSQLEPIIESEVNMHEEIFKDKGVTEVKDRIAHYFSTATGDSTLNSMNSKENINKHVENKEFQKLVLKNKVKADTSIGIENKEITNEVSKKLVLKDNNGMKSVEIREKIIECIANVLRMSPKELNLKLSLSELGMDSISGVEMIRDINKTFNTQFETIITYDFSDVISFVKYIEQEVDVKGALSVSNEKIGVTNKIEVREQVQMKEEVAATGEGSCLENQNVKQEIVKLICKILQIESNEVNLKLSVNELGMDFITGLELIRDINKKFNLEMEAVMLNDFPNIIGLIHSVEEQISGQSPSVDKTDEPEDKLLAILEQLKNNQIDIDKVNLNLEDMI